MAVVEDPAKETQETPSTTPQPSTTSQPPLCVDLDGAIEIDAEWGLGRGRRLRGGWRSFLGLFRGIFNDSHSGAPSAIGH